MIVDATLKKVDTDDGTIKQKAFEKALEGMRKNQMSHEDCPLAEILADEVEKRSAKYEGLSSSEESKLLSLKKDQKRLIIQTDKASKEEYLSSPPSTQSQGLKAHPKFTAFVDYLGNLTKKDVSE